MRVRARPTLARSSPPVSPQPMTLSSLSRPQQLLQTTSSFFPRRCLLPLLLSARSPSWSSPSRPARRPTRSRALPASAAPLSQTDGRERPSSGARRARCSRASLLSRSRRARSSRRWVVSARERERGLAGTNVDDASRSQVQYLPKQIESSTSGDATKGASPSEEDQEPPELMDEDDAQAYFEDLVLSGKTGGLAGGLAEAAAEERRKAVDADGYVLSTLDEPQRGEWIMKRTAKEKDGPWSLTKRLWRQEGPAGPWKGRSPSLLLSMLLRSLVDTDYLSIRQASGSPSHMMPSRTTSLLFSSLSSPRFLPRPLGRPFSFPRPRHTSSSLSSPRIRSQPSCFPRSTSSERDSSPSLSRRSTALLSVRPRPLPRRPSTPSAACPSRTSLPMRAAGS